MSLLLSSSIGDYTVYGAIFFGRSPARGEDPTTVYIDKVQCNGEDVDLRAFSDDEFEAFERSLFLAAMKDTVGTCPQWS